MRFIEQFKKSVYGPEFYQGLFRRPLSFSFGYFYSLVLVLSLVLTAVFSVRLIPALNAFIANFGPSVLASFPDNLVIELKDGKASSNREGPVVIKIPEAYRGNVLKKGSEVAVENILVVDTESEFTLERFRGASTRLYLTRDSIAFQGERGNLQISRLSDFPNTTLNKERLRSFVRTIERFSLWLSPLMVILLMALFVFLFSLKLSYLAFAALLVWAFLKLRGADAGYMKAYQIGLHAISVGLVVDTVAFFYAPFSRVPFLFTALLLGTVLINIKGGTPPEAVPEAVPAS
ncbi:MAG: DUF1189 family protein [Candidatus Liptonbacteria bacterium]|nr:DUF1189 family protein [Candidatus Liptonbacteria bacterium]